MVSGGAGGMLGNPQCGETLQEPSVTLGRNIQSDKPNISNFSILTSPSSPAVILETCRQGDKVAAQTWAGFQGNGPPLLVWMANLHTCAPLLPQSRRVFISIHFKCDHSVRAAAAH